MEKLTVGHYVWVKEKNSSNGQEGIVIRKANEPLASWVQVNDRLPGKPADEIEDRTEKENKIEEGVR